MVASHAPVKRIESIYPPEQLRTASPVRRLAGCAIDLSLPIVTVLGTIPVVVAFTVGLASAGMGSQRTTDTFGALLFSATLVSLIAWWCVCATRGQSPGKRMLSMYVLREDGTRAGFRSMLLREFGLKYLLTFGANFFSAGAYGLLASLWCLWDRDHQCLWDKIGSTYVAWSPMGYEPGTACDCRRTGTPPPELQAAQPPAVP